MGLMTFLARRFVAGRTPEAAIRAVRRLNARGICATIDILGENVTKREEAVRAADAYVSLLDLIAKERVDANVSLKLTMMGLDIDAGLCRDNVLRVLEAAARHKSFVRVDMEGSAYTQATLDVVRALFAQSPNVGAVVQAYLYRSEADIAALNEAGIRTRLCKGAYLEPKTVAFRDKREVNANYSKLMRLLLEAGPCPAIATHDGRLIAECKALVAQNGLRKDQFEFQMLYGIRSALQRKLAAEGYRVRCYVPFGTHWLPYFLRRLRERRANVTFVLRNLFRR
jgi:proline dehydrogenase